MRIAISAESAIDLTKELIEKYDFKIVPFSVILGDKCAYDGEITSKEIIDYVTEHKVLPKTSAVNEEQYREHFGNLLKDYDAIIHFSISSKLSSAYNNALNVAKEFKNVYVVDTLILSSGIALPAIYARKLVDKGCDPEFIYQECLKRVPNIKVSFVLKRIDYLYKGGRCSALALLGANILRIKPQIILSEGKMISGKKYRGNFSHAVDLYLQDALDTCTNPDLDEIFITYTTADDEIIQRIKDRLIEEGFKNIHITTAGATITSHCGENCLGILFINDGIHE